MKFLAKSLDLMQSVEDTVKWKAPSSSYTFNHLTLQEFLAALHWSQLPPQQLTELLQRQDLFPVQQYLKGMQHTRKEEEESVGVIHWPVLLFIAGLTTIPPELVTPFTGPPDNEEILFHPSLCQLLFEAQSPQLVSTVFKGRKTQTWPVVITTGLVHYRILYHSL